MKQLVDRGDVITGSSKTIRDARVPYNKARSIENFSLPDSRARRRPGYKVTSTKTIVGQMLTKHSPSIIERKLQVTAGDTKHDVYRTPLSYALIQHHSTFQPKTITNWTMDFWAVLGEHESLVVTPYERRTRKTTGSPTWDLQLRRPGVYLLDWTILSNYHKFDPGTIAAPAGEIVLTADHTGAGNQFFDSFPLTTLAISFTKAQLQVDMGLIEKSGANIGRYWPNAIQLTYAFGGSGYIPGTGYHIAVKYTLSDRVVSLIVDGVVRASFTVPSSTTYGFVGEYDVINGETYTEGLPRGLVLLNECAVRGSYASACKIQKNMHGHQTFYQDFSTNLSAPNMPWACSPPRGTAIRDLRIWNIGLTLTEIANIAKKTLAKGSLNVVANWVLDSGVPINFDLENNYPCTLHHTYPSYISHPNLLNKVGLNFAEGQHIVLKLNAGEKNLIRDIAAEVANCFGHDASDDVFAKIQARHEVTGMIQLVTPKSWQPELNKATTSAPFNTRNILSSNLNGETRRSMSGSNSFNNCGLYRLVDGGTVPYEGSGGGKTFILNQAGSSATGDEEFNRAYDMTLFSIETGSLDTTSTGEAKTWKVPLFRGLITPTGQVALEVSLSGGPAASSPRFYRVVSSSSLSLDTTYTVTFVKRATYNSANLTNLSGIIFEIYVGTGVTPPSAPTITFTREILLAQAITSHTVGNPHQVNITMPSYLANGELIEVTIAGVGGTLGGAINGTWVATKNSTGFTVSVNTTGLTDGGTPGTVDFNPSLRSSFIKGSEDYDIVVGCSNIRDTWDRSITGPNATAYTTGEGPWSVSQHFMSPYQDQPGNFMLGFFRLWSKALDLADIQLFNSIAIPEKRFDKNLIINVEVSSITGTRIPNSTKYDEILEMGFKGWGHPQAYQFKHLSDPTLTFKNLNDPMISSGFSMEDCLGYSALINNTTEYNSGKLESCRGLAGFQTTLTRQFGLLAAYGENFLVDKSLSGVFGQLYHEYGGILAEFVGGVRWRGLNIADRTLLVSSGAAPKVYDGRSFTYAGFRKWSGGALLARQTALIAPATGLAPGWYALRLVYNSETRGLQHISEPVFVEISSGGNKAIAIFLLQQHPDPRISSYTIYRSRTQLSKQLAQSAPLFPISTLNFSNGSKAVHRLEDPDTALVSFVLDTEFTQLPECSLVEAVNDRVYFAGDFLIPDAVFFTDLGNPERIDINSQALILEGGGNKIIYMVGMYSTLFVFKTNSVWRIEELNGVHQVEKVADVGAVSEDAVVTIVNPDSGRTTIFFWSQHGPYLFDGAAPVYIGFDTEEKVDPGVLSSEFNWLDPTSVLVLHDLRNREVICMYKPKVGGTVFPRRSEGIVYNYRFNSWYRYTGLLGNATMSQLFSGESFTGFGQSSAPIITIGNGPFTPSTIYTAYIGGTNGKLYRWGEAEEDGLPDSTAGPYIVSCYDPIGIITLLGSNLTIGAYKHLYITVIRPSTGVLFTVPIDDNDTGTVTISLLFGALPFEPEEGDKVYLCLPPASIEFPWDILNAPFVEKQVLELVTWSNKEFYLNLFKDWNSTSAGRAVTWKRLNNSSGRRNRTLLNTEAEAIKLFLYSLEKGASLDSFAYNVDFREGAVKIQS